MKGNPYTYIGLTAGALILWLFTAYAPVHRDQNAARHKIEALQSRLADFQSTLAQLPLYVSTSKQLDSARQNLSEKLYTKSEVIKLLNQLYKAADEHELEIVDVTPPIEELLKLNEIVTDSLQPPFLNVSLKIEGQYTNFGRFIEAVEKRAFFRGTNMCMVRGSVDELRRLDFQFGFKALLGVAEVKS